MVYPAGHNVVLYSQDTKTQKLIPGTLESEGITALAVSSNKKLLAVAERAEKAMITVYDLQTLKRRKVLVAADAGSKVRHCATPLRGSWGWSAVGCVASQHKGASASGPRHLSVPFLRTYILRTSSTVTKAEGN